MARPAIPDEVRDDLTAFLDGEADPETRARIEARLNSDPQLRAEADAMTKAWELLDHLPRPETSSNFTSRTLAQVSAIRPVATTTLALPTTLRRVPWVMLATVIGGLCVGWFATGYLAPPRGPAPLKSDDPVLVKDLRLIDVLPQYLAAESMEFLQMLEQSDRFGSDVSGP